MPMRVMGYDYGSYKKQYDSNARQYKTAEGMDADEYLSKMKKTDKSKPLTETRNKAIDYAKKNAVAKSVVMTVAGAANCRIDYNALDKKGDTDMCTVFEETRIEGKLEGEAKGIIETGFDFALSENDIMERLQKKLNISIQTAQEYIKMFGKKTV